jgi:HAD superfamily hydrolase (TIGR01509 family)
MTQLQIKTVLFDFDGTLVDTEPSAVSAVKKCFQKWNLKIVSEDASFVTGRTWDSAFEFLFSKYALPIEKSSAKKEILDLYHREIETNLVVVPGSIEAVHSLAQNYPLGLVSGSPHADIIWALTKLGILNHFKIILGAEDYPRSKPAPDGYLKAAAYLKTKPSECLVFEDSTAGIGSAKAAGMWAVAITSTNHFSQDVSLSDFRTQDLRPINSKWVQHLSID